MFKSLATNFKQIFSILLKIYGAYRWQMALLTALGFVSGVLDALGIGALIPFFSLVVERTSHTSDFITGTIERILGVLGVSLHLWSLVVFVIVLFILKSAVKFSLAMLRTYITSNYTLNLRNDLYRGVLNTSWPYIMNQRIGYLENVLMTDVAMAEKIFRSLTSMVPMIATFLVYVSTAIKISPRISIAALIVGFTVLLLLKPLFSKTRAFRKKLVSLNKEITHTVNEHVQGIKTVKIMGVESYVINHVAAKFKEIWRIGITTAFVIHLGKEPVEPVSIIFVLIVFGFSYNDPAFQLGTFAAVIYLVQRIFAYIRDFFEMGQNMYQLMAHLYPVLSLQQDVIKNKDRMGGSEEFVFNKHIKLDEVLFAYDNHRKILQGISLEVKKGHTIGLVGESGGGKTTIADLLLGLFKPTSGSISIDGVDIAQFKVAELRSRIGYVSQDIFLKNDTIASNIRFYNDALTQADIELAARQAHIYDTIMTLPKGFDTVVGERGVRLSGGQRQRIVLARVLARRPEILILDEATSSLDNESEAEIKKTLLELRGNITMIIIAHRLTTVKDCDMIYVLKDGAIAESGTPDALLDDENSLFYKMQNAGE